MRHLSTLFIFAAIGFAADGGKGYRWEPAPQQVEVGQGGLDIVLSDPLPHHWVLTVLTARGEPNVASVSAGSVALDGPFVERVDNLDLRRLEVKPGLVHISGIPNESGLAVCVTIPAGSRVRVLHDEHLITSSTTGVVIQDAKLVAQDRGVLAPNAKLCPSLPLLQQALLGK